jgi:hypothetical protein
LAWGLWIALYRDAFASENTAGSEIRNPLHLRYKVSYYSFFNPFIILQTTVVYSAKLCGDVIRHEEELTVESLRG